MALRVTFAPNSWQGFIARVCSDSMRQAFVNVLASDLSPRAWPTSRRLGSPRGAGILAFAVGAGLLSISTMVLAEPLPAASPIRSPASPTVARAKPVVVIPREPKQQAKNFVSAGPIFGFTTHLDSDVTGILGLELSYVRYPYAAFGFGMGAFAQAQTVGFNHARYAFGPQFNFMMFGAEVGAYLEEGSGKRAMTVGVHASPFVSLGFFSAALRLAVPIGTLTEGEPYGIDLGLVCAIKIPVPLDGQLFGLAFH